jgi:flagellar protein FliO/FliZ
MELLGSMPDTLKFVVVFVLILGILVPLVWRWFNVGPLRHGGLHGRHHRLSVIETVMVDVRHRLVLVKRDNVEHLLLVGGPSNLVVEASITRPGAVAREPRPIPDARPEPARQPAAETPDWSLPLEPVARPVHMVDLDAALPEPPARTAREAMADSMRAVRSGAAARRTPPVDLNDIDEDVAAPALSPSPGEANHRAAQPQRGPSAPEAAASNDGSPEPRRDRAVPAAPRPAPPAPAAAAPAANPAARPASAVPAGANPPARPASAAPPPASDQGNFAEMAQRLEAALRRPARTESPGPARQPRQEPPAGRRPGSPDPRARAKSAEAPPPDLKVLPGKGQNELAMENLEDEMAKMLGRPGKS